MSDERRDKAARIARRAAWPVALVVAFGLGLAITGGDDGAAPDRGDHAGHAGHGGHGEASAQIWTCSMHPQIRSPEPGQCPICGMDLIPLVEDQGADDAPDRVSLSERARVKARIRTAPVQRLRPGGVERRLLGKVDYDETRLRTITSWIGGRIERLDVRTTGQRIRRYQVIATLYSPEVFSAHQDLLVAGRQVARLAGATETARAAAQATLEAARDRLRLVGVPADEIAAMEQAGSPSERVRIRSPFAGTVIELMAAEGEYIATGSSLYRIADLSRLWVQLDAYASDLPFLKLGQEVSLTVEALPAEVFEGRVTFVDPVLDRRTRTTRVRIEVANPDGQLRPGMFAEAVVRGASTGASAGDRALVVPDTAPLFTGRRSVVYVEVPDVERPTYQARVVRLGARMGDVYPVLAGLAEGERVVIHGAFALDADLQIRGGASMMNAPDDAADGSHDIVPVPDEHREPLAEVVRHYLALQEALSGDDLAAAVAASAALARAATAVEPASPAQLRQAWMPLRRQLVAHASQVSEASSLADARTRFRDLSQQIATLLRVFGNPTGETLRLAFCPMALSEQGAEWVQRAAEIENPYFGASMHTCGEVHSVVEHGTYLPAAVAGKGAGKDTGKGAEQPTPAGGHQH